MNFDKARQMMVDNQIRPNNINNNDILNIFHITKKEAYLPKEKQNSAYIDSEIELGENKFYLTNLHIAQLLQAANLSKYDNILHLGSLSGYVTFMLSKLANNVVAVESSKDLFDILKNNIKKFSMDNVFAVNDDYENGYEKNKPYDVIFIDSIIEYIPDALYKQLKNDRGKIVAIEKIDSNLSKGIIVTKNNSDSFKEYIFDSLSHSLPQFKLKKYFNF